MIDDEWKQEVANDDAALKPTTKLDAMNPTKADLLQFAEAIAQSVYDDPDNEPPKVASEDAHAQRNEWIARARSLLGKPPLKVP